jgi:hypothetical protein
MRLHGAGRLQFARTGCGKAAGSLLRRLFSPERKVTTMSNQTPKPFTAVFIADGEKVILELTNTCDEVLKEVEILAVFLKDQATPDGSGPSRSHIKFDPIKAIKPKEKAVFTHRTWIDGKPVVAGLDQLDRLQVLEGEVTPYVLDISWEDSEGKSRFQRIPVGH